MIWKQKKKNRKILSRLNRNAVLNVSARIAPAIKAVATAPYIFMNRPWMTLPTGIKASNI